MEQLPSIGWAQRDFRLQRSESFSRSGNRMTNVVEFADPVWTIALQTHWMNARAMASFEAWRDNLRGALRPLIYVDPAYRAPASHVDASGPELKAGTLAAIGGDNILTVSGVDPRLVLVRGDYVTFAQGGLRALARVVGTLGAGTTRTISIEPRLPREIVVGASVHFDRVELVMRQVPGTYSVTRQSSLQAASLEFVESRL